MAVEGRRQCSGDVYVVDAMECSAWPWSKMRCMHPSKHGARDRWCCRSSHLTQVSRATNSHVDNRVIEIQSMGESPPLNLKSDDGQVFRHKMARMAHSFGLAGTVNRHVTTACITCTESVSRRRL